MTEKKDRKEIFGLFVQAFNNKDFRIISGLNPCIVEYAGARLNVYIKNLTPAQLSNNNPDVWRCQLPKRPIFDDFKASKDLFLLLGYDASCDVYATWNPYWAKQRLNVGESVSMYSRHSIQQEASNTSKIIKFDLRTKGFVVVFPRLILTDYIDHITEYFCEETTYEAIGSSLRKKDKNSKVHDLIKLCSPKAISQIAEMMCKEESQELYAMQVLYEEIGDSYNQTMSLADWLQLLRDTNWKDYQ